MSEYRELDSLRLTVHEDKSDYSLSLRRVEKYGNGEHDSPHGLYVVLMVNPFWTKSVHVLAENEEGAKSQALCWAELESHKEGAEEVLAVTAVTVKRVPLVLRGWGKREF